MGRTYIPKNKKAKGNLGKNFDMNFSGCEILGCLMKAVDEHNKKLEEEHARFNIVHKVPCTWFKMPKRDCLRAAKKLRALSDDALAVVLNQCRHCFEPGSKVADLRAFMVEWADFLETCGGYEVPG